MKYKLLISYPNGQYILWNRTKDNEWQVTFEYEHQMILFLKELLENTTHEY